MGKNRQRSPDKEERCLFLAFTAKGEGEAYVCFSFESCSVLGLCPVLLAFVGFE